MVRQRLVAEIEIIQQEGNTRVKNYLKCRNQPCCEGTEGETMPEGSRNCDLGMASKAGKRVVQFISGPW